MNCAAATAETLASRAGADGGILSTSAVSATNSLGRDGEGSIWGCDAAHNFTDKRTYLPCLVRAAVNGVAGDFVFISFLHAGDL